MTIGSYLPCKLFIFAFAMFGLNAHAAMLSNAKVVALKNGVNDVTVAGRQFKIVSGWRENFNAHGFTVTTMYAELPRPDGKMLLQIVPVFLRNATDPDDPRETDELQTSGGADCTLHAFRLFTTTGVNSVMLVIAERDYGDSFFDTQAVHFDFYRLAKNTEGIFGRPTLYFAFDHRIDASKKYCDVDKALKEELGLPWVEGTGLPWSDGNQR